MKTKANGIELAYQVQGKGHALVLIAGVGYGMWYWHKVLPALSERFQVITFDNRGAGESDKPDGPYSVPMLAADTVGLLDNLGASGAYILGHSLGGFIAQELAVTRPDLVSKLILASTNPGGPHVIPITTEAMQVLLDRSGDPVELIRRGVGIACAPGFADRKPDVVDELIDYRLTNPVPGPNYQAQVMAGAGMSMLSEDQVLERMHSIQVPVLILFGEHDRVVPPGNAEMMASLLPNATIQILPGCGHMFPIEDPQSAVQVITHFLDN
jgi:pimeloyl-ACP methyl ester carboxylesterase